MNKFKWQQEIDKQVKNETNDELYEHLIDVAQPDDYDGIHSNRASYEYSTVQRELVKRLIDTGFLLPF